MRSKISVSFSPRKRGYLISGIEEAIFKPIEWDCIKGGAILRLHWHIVNLVM